MALPPQRRAQMAADEAAGAGQEDFHEVIEGAGEERGLLDSAIAIPIGADPVPTHLLRNAFASGSAASILSSLVLAGRGRRETPSAAAPINAVSHWLYGRRAYRVDKPSARHTLPGLGIHHLSAVFWGFLFEALLERLERPRAPTSKSSARGQIAPIVRLRHPTPTELGVAAAAVTALAALTDLRLVPERLTPGFQHRLRPASVALVYLGFAAGLALGAAAMRRPQG